MFEAGAGCEERPASSLSVRSDHSDSLSVPVCDDASRHILTPMDHRSSSLAVRPWSHLGSDMSAECFTLPQYVLRSKREAGRSLPPGNEADMVVDCHQLLEGRRQGVFVCSQHTVQQTVGRPMR